jgi:hypothetical protein
MRCSEMMADHFFRSSGLTRPRPSGQLCGQAEHCQLISPVLERDERHKFHQCR